MAMIPENNRDAPRGAHQRENGAIRTAAITLALAGAVAACDVATDSPDTVLAPDQAPLFLAASNGGAPDLASQVAPVRALAARYHDFQASQDAGYTVRVTDCVENPPTGAMGIHFLNPAYVDDVVSPLTPEIVFYEPQKDGRLRFVGVEYIIPYSFVPETDPAPTLFGEPLLHNAGDQLWMMHLWIGRHNPDGLLATWNPNVSCRYAL